jgi:succinoglycan biosynthesis protein ExoO
VQQVIQSSLWRGPAPCSEESVGATIIIPTYQAEATLARAIQSALDQTMRDIEIIVADDGSTDSTWQMISAWLAKEPRLRGLRNEHNRGKSATMNHATSFARGRWLAVLDADDWYHPDRLSALVAIGERCNVAMVADNQLLCDAAAKIVVGPGWPTGGGDWPLSFDDYLRGCNVYDAFDLGMLKPIVRSEFVRTSQLSYDESARFGEDFLYLLQLFLMGANAAVCDTPYYFYTQPFGTVSRQWSHGGRQRYDFQSACDRLEAHSRAAANRLSADQAVCLKKRCRQLGSLENYFRAKESLSQRGWQALLAHLIEHPVTLDYALRRLFARHASGAAARVANGCRHRSAIASDNSSTV